MLVMADRGFFSFELWAELMATGADLLFRVPAHLKLPPSEALPDGSFISEIRSPRTRSSGYRIPLSAVGDPQRATHSPVRVVEYTVTGTAEGRDPDSSVFRVITTILDPDDLAAAEIAAAYHERWEYEITLKEIETQMLEPGGGLRSRSPELIRQELWGLPLSALRHTIAHGRSSAVSRNHPPQALVHEKHQRRPPPGHRPGGIFPPDG